MPAQMPASARDLAPFAAEQALHDALIVQIASLAERAHPALLLPCERDAGGGLERLAGLSGVAMNLANGRAAEREEREKSECTH